MPDPTFGSQALRARSRLAIPIGVSLATVVGAECAVVIGGARLVGAAGLALVLVATAAWVLVVSDARIDQHPGLVALAIGVAIAVGLAVPPRNSHDLWSYVAYGRMISVHHLSPYTHVPLDFGHDPFLGRVAAGWRHTTSVYGPLFSAASAMLTRGAGASVLRARLAFQCLATVGVVASLALIWRTTRSARAVAFVGLHPAVITAIVNGGHNDSLIGLAILGGALLATHKRWYGAGVVLGLGVLVKASGVFGLLGVAVWSIGRDRRGAVRLVLAAGVTAVVGYAPVGTPALRALGHAGNSGNSRASVWDPISSLLHPATGVMTGVVLLFAIVAAWQWRTASRPDTTALVTTAAFLIGGVYVLPWYPAWALPTAALRSRTRLSALVAAHAALLAAVYEYELPAHPILTGVWGGLRSVLLQAAAWSALVVFVMLVIAQRARARRAPASPTPIPTAAPPSPRSCC